MHKIENLVVELEKLTSLMIEGFITKEDLDSARRVIQREINQVIAA